MGIRRQRKLSKEIFFVSPSLTPLLSSLPLPALYSDVHNNNFSGSLWIDIVGSAWLYLDISNNHFDFSLQDLPLMPPTFNASGNCLRGSLRSLVMPHILDLSNNCLSGSLQWHVLAQWFLTGTDFLSIAGNPELPSSSVPRELHVLDLYASYHGYQCPILSFSGLRESFFYDERLFEYELCECGAGTFGVVAEGCQSCALATPGSVQCLGSTTFSIASNYYPYYDDQGRLNTEMCVSNPDFVPEILNPCPAHSALSTFQVATQESCRQGSSGRKCSECMCDADECWFRRGLRCVKCSPAALRLHRASFLLAFALLLALACIIFSALTLLLVRRRTRLLDYGQFDGLPIGLWGTFLFAASHGIPKILIAFVQFTSVLTNWNNVLDTYMLKLFNFDTSGFGFQCVFKEFTQPVPIFLLKILVPLGILVLLWICIGVASVLWRVGRTFFRWKNGNGISTEDLIEKKEGRRLLLQESEEDVMADGEGDDGGADLERHLTATTSAKNVHLIQEDFLQEKDSNPSGETLTSNPSGETLASNPSSHALSVPLQPPQPTTKQQQPQKINQFLRLGVSISTSLVNLFYFGVSMAIISSFFSEHQPNTSDAYMSTFPYLGWTDRRARRLRLVAGLFFVLVPAVPIATAILLIYFKRRLQEPRVRAHIGSLYQAYRPSLFWWDFAGLARKFLVVVAASITSNLALRHWLLVSTFALFLALQVAWQPWKRRVENQMDTLSSLTIIISLVANVKMVGVPDEGTAVLILVARAIMLVFVVVALAVWIWSVVKEKRQFNKRRNSNSSMIRLADDSKEVGDERDLA